MGLLTEEFTFPEIPLVLIDTTGCDMWELETSDEISRANEGEVSLVCVYVKKLIESGVKPKDIAVITPYNLQVTVKVPCEVYGTLLGKSNCFCRSSCYACN